MARYKGKKGKFWEVFSKFIRIRDFKRYGTCISCGTTIDDWKYCDAGHYVAAGHCGFGLLFDEENVNAQCKKCNNPRWTPDAGVGYSHGLDRRYGKGTAAKLYKRYEDSHFKGKVTKEWSDKEYDQKIEIYQLKIKELEK